MSKTILQLNRVHESACALISQIEQEVEGDELERRNAIALATHIKNRLVKCLKRVANTGPALSA